jgi:hypothetical protein
MDEESRQGGSSQGGLKIKEKFDFWAIPKATAGKQGHQTVDCTQIE